MTGLPPRCLLLSISRTLPGRRRPRGCSWGWRWMFPRRMQGARAGQQGGTARMMLPREKPTRAPTPQKLRSRGSSLTAPYPALSPQEQDASWAAHLSSCRPLHLPCFPPGHGCWVNCIEAGSGCTNSITTHGCCCLGARRMSVQLGKREVAFRIPWSGSAG